MNLLIIKWRTTFAGLLTSKIVKGLIVERPLKLQMHQVTARFSTKPRHRLRDSSKQHVEVSSTIFRDVNFVTLYTDYFSTGTFFDSNMSEKVLSIRFLVFQDVM